MPFPVRHTPRANWHKYNGAEYFVTICTGGREHYFGEVHNGQTQLSAVGECLRAQIEMFRIIIRIPQSHCTLLCPTTRI